MKKPGCAGIFYEGLHHKYALDGIRAIRKVLGPESIDFGIISAKYGVLNEMDFIEPYDLSFNTMKHDEIINHARDLKIHEDLQEKVPNYNVVFYLMGLDYLKALELPFWRDGITQHIFLVSPAYQSIITDFTHNRKKGHQDHRDNYFVFDAGSQLGIDLGVQNIALKGYVFKRFGEYMENGGEYHARDVRIELYSNTQFFFQSFLDHLIVQRKEEKEKVESKQISLL